MNRALLVLSSVSGLSSLLLIDSAIKGTALLLLAATIVFFLRRDSAATRHLVWLVAIVAMLAVPLLSALLPQWRVLPEWANIAQVQAGNRNGSDVKNGIYENHNSHTSDDSHDFDVPDKTQFHEPTSLQLPTTNLSALPADTIPAPPVAAASTGWSWRPGLVAVWFAGFALLAFRLAVARVLLWQLGRKASRSCLPGTTSRPLRDLRPREVPTSEQVAGDKTELAFTAACATLHIQQHITLLLHPDKTIPVVWGIFRPRLMLPVAAQDWSDEQLRSVLLHELAHIKRRDVLGQLLAQFACTLHWFNPLVWFAAWRMHVERELACDDLVLQSGVRASAYAEHLLNVATRLSSSPWTQACGLAMARNSSLHDRLTAVLSEKQNRRRVSKTMLTATFLICTAVVAPVAMLGAADETPAESDDAPTTSTISNAEPVKQLNTLPGSPTSDAATDATVRRRMKRQLQVEVDFATVCLAKAKVDLAQRLDANKHGAVFTQEEIKRAESAVMHAEETVRKAIETANEQQVESVGQPLPPDLEKAPWGDPVDGLRVAMIFDPATNEAALGASLKRRLLIHNAGNEKRKFRLSMTSLESPGKGTPHRGESGPFYVYPPALYGTVSFHYDAVELAAGEFAEFPLAMIGFGLELNESSSTQRSLWMIMTQSGDEFEFFEEVRITLPHAKFSLERPVSEIFGGRRITLTTKPIGLKILPYDRNAARKIRTTSSRGHVNLGESTRLFIRRDSSGDSAPQSATIAVRSAKDRSGFKSIKQITLSEPYLFAWERYSGLLWLAEKGVLRKFDFTNPDDVQESRVEPASPNDVPERMRELISPVLIGTIAVEAPNGKP